MEYVAVLSVCHSCLLFPPIMSGLAGSKQW